MEGEEIVEDVPDGGRKRKYRRDKPWDDETIDHFKIDEWKPEYMPAPLLEASSFSTLFPKYREGYLREIWPIATKALKVRGIDCELNLIEGSMTVTTTQKTSDPYIIVKSRDFIKLLARSVPVQQALKVLQDGVQCDIIKIGGIVRNKERFVKRRQRIVGPDGATLKALELLTSCYILVQGNTVAAIGSWKGLKDVRKVSQDCMKNIHPVYHIKTLMIKRELQKDPTLKNEDWSRFLPEFRKRTASAKKKAPIAQLDDNDDNEQKRKKKRTSNDKPLFPPPQAQRLVDYQLESGEYFMSKSSARALQHEQVEVQQETKRREKIDERRRKYDIVDDK